MQQLEPATKMCHSPGTPFNGLMPRSAKHMPERVTTAIVIYSLRRSGLLIRQLDAHLANDLGIFFRVRRIKLGNLARTHRLHRL